MLLSHFTFQLKAAFGAHLALGHPLHWCPCSLARLRFTVVLPLAGHEAPVSHKAARVPGLAAARRLRDQETRTEGSKCTLTALEGHATSQHAASADCVHSRKALWSKPGLTVAPTVLPVLPGPVIIVAQVIVLGLREGPAMFGEVVRPRVWLEGAVAAPVAHRAALVR
jgi:hypothetical protein